MIKVNTFILLFIVEFVLIFLCLSIFLFIKNRKLKAEKIIAERSHEELEKFFEEMISNLQNELNQLGDNLDTEQMTLKESHSSTLRFIQGVLNGIRSNRDDDRLFWEKVTKNFKEIINNLFQKINTSEPEAATEKIEEIKKQDSLEYDLKDDVYKLQKIVKEQRKKIINLLGYRDLYESLQQKLITINKINKNLKDTILSIVPQAEISKELEKMLNKFEQNNEELNMCVRVLEKENDRFSHEIKGLEEDVEKLTQSPADSVDREILISEKDALKGRVQELEDKLKHLEKAYENLQKNYDILEVEYSNLYKEHQGNQ